MVTLLILGKLLESTNCSGSKFVITESVFSMDGDQTDLSAIVDLCEEHNAGLIVDEAHSVGLFGDRGSGLLEQLKIEVLASVNTAGKSLGCSGAFVCGSRTLIDLLINRCRAFIFSTAPSPGRSQLRLSPRLISSKTIRNQDRVLKESFLSSTIRVLEKGC